jgi:hypothetical protein
MIFAALVLLAMYLPQRTVLQEAAQVAAVAIATERSDTWISFENNGSFRRAHESEQPNVYVKAFTNTFGNNNSPEAQHKAQHIVENVVRNSFMPIPGTITVRDPIFTNAFFYKEVVITVERQMNMPVNLSLIGFPTSITLTQEARAVILDGDEFVRTVDIAKDIFLWLDNKLDISGNLEGVLNIINDPAIKNILEG